MAEQDTAPDRYAHISWSFPGVNMLSQGHRQFVDLTPLFFQSDSGRLRGSNLNAISAIGDVMPMDVQPDARYEDEIPPINC